jgi:hypothetical protein
LKAVNGNLLYIVNFKEILDEQKRS